MATLEDAKPRRIQPFGERAIDCEPDGTFTSGRVSVQGLGKCVKCWNGRQRVMAICIKHEFVHRRPKHGGGRAQKRRMIYHRRARQDVTAAAHIEGWPDHIQEERELSGRGEYVVYPSHERSGAAFPLRTTNSQIGRSLSAYFVQTRPSYPFPFRDSVRPLQEVSKRLLPLKDKRSNLR